MEKRFDYEEMIKKTMSNINTLTITENDKTEFDDLL